MAAGCRRRRHQPPQFVPATRSITGSWHGLCSQHAEHHPVPTSGDVRAVRLPILFWLRPKASSTPNRMVKHVRTRVVKNDTQKASRPQHSTDNEAYQTRFAWIGFANRLRARDEQMRPRAKPKHRMGSLSGGSSASSFRRSGFGPGGSRFDAVFLAARGVDAAVLLVAVRRQIAGGRGVAGRRAGSTSGAALTFWMGVKIGETQPRPPIPRKRLRESGGRSTRPEPSGWPFSI